METDILVIALAVLGFGVLAGRLEGTSLTMPMIFTAAGLVLGPSALGLLDLGVENEFVSALAEATLVLVLFTDASRMDIRTVLREHDLALRLLAVGLPLAVVIGAAVGLVLFPDLPVASVALLAAVLAPTDAALGQAFVSDETVPRRIRQTLNVESGLNDGLAVPFITVLLDVSRHQADSPLNYVALFAELVGIGVAVGAATGWLGGKLLEWSTARSWTTAVTRRMATVALAAVAFAGSELLGGNGFVAAFVAGLVVGSTARSLLPEVTNFSEAEGQLLTLVTFLLFGAVLVADVLSDVTWKAVLYALLSLLLVRPVAVALALVAAKVRPATFGFLAWAGPRGLASIVYAVLILRTEGVPGADTVFVVASCTIVVSIYLHGLSAAPLSARYGSLMQRTGGVEHHPVAELPIRFPFRRHRPGSDKGGSDKGGSDKGGSGKGGTEDDSAGREQPTPRVDG